MADAGIITRRNGASICSSLINDILDLSKIEAGKMSVDRILCCPAKVVGDVCSLLRHRAEEKGLTLDVAFNGSHSEVDKDRIRHGCGKCLSISSQTPSNSPKRVAFAWRYRFSRRCMLKIPCLM